MCGVRVKVTIVAVALTLLVRPASADTLTDFTVSGIFTDAFHDNFPLTGTIIADGTTDLITGASLRLAGEPWTNIISQGLSGGDYDVSIQTSVMNFPGCSANTSNCFDTLTLALSAPPSTLIANGGGSIVSGYSYLYDAGFPISLEAGTGSLVAPSPTPLPATLPLFAAGLGTLGLLGWLRKRKAPAVA